MPYWRGIEQALPEITTTGDNNLAGFFFFPKSASSWGFLHGGRQRITSTLARLPTEPSDKGKPHRRDKKEGSRDFLPFGLRSGL